MKITAFIMGILLASVSLADLVGRSESKTVDVSKIAGSYSNTLGSELNVEVKLEGGQLDFFEGSNYIVEISGTLSEETGLKAEEFDFVGVEKDGSVAFERYDDCDYNSCTSFEGVLTFKPKKDGGYYVSVEVSAHSWNYEDPVYIAADHFIEKVTEEDFLKLYKEEEGVAFSGVLTRDAIDNFIDDRVYDDRFFLDSYGSKKYFPEGPKMFICKTLFGSVTTIVKESLATGENYSDCYFDQKVFLKKD